MTQSQLISCEHTNAGAFARAGLIFAVVLAAMLPNSALAANDGHSSSAAAPGAGNSKAKIAVCQACHGADGATPLQPDYPKLAGQHRDYLARALREYRNGTRKNPIMTGQGATLTDADIAFLSSYYANLPSSVFTLTGRR